jgi:alpha-L-fucosidase
MSLRRRIAGFALLGLFVVGCSRGNLDAIKLTSSLDAISIDSRVSPPSTLEELQRAYIELRFGMLIKFGILTYTGSWLDANLPIDKFNPTNLKPGQWADAAVAAKMKFAVMSTRYVDGFALWDSAVSSFDVGSIPWQDGHGDVVREFVDAFRARGLIPGFLYSVADNTQGIGTGTVTKAQIDYVKAQITELLTNYGPIGLLVFTGWAWLPGHNEVPYPEIRELVKSIQPNCLLLDTTMLLNAWEVDVPCFDESKGMFVPADSVIPATQAQNINTSGGNEWFWAPDFGNLLSVTDIVDGHLRKLESRFTNFLLNCPPNRDGLLDSAVVDRLAEVGAAWSPDTSRAPLPVQEPWNEFPYTPVQATATSGKAWNAIDGIEMFTAYTVWESSGALPQSITIDLGQVRPDVGILNYVPRYAGMVVPQSDGAITSYAVFTSIDGNDFTTATTGSWLSNGNMKVATFGPVAARYVRLEARAVTGTTAAATEISIGARR